MKKTSKTNLFVEKTKIFSKLFKTELGTHKVDLALVDDVKNLYDNANKIYTKKIIHFQDLTEFS
jgi:hypothetical protein